MSRDNFVKRRKFQTSMAKGTGGINDCFRPSAEASKADLVEFHSEEMKLRRSRQRKRERGLTPVQASQRVEKRLLRKSA